MRKDNVLIHKISHKKGIENMDKFVCIPEDERSTWYLHMQYFMTEKFGIKKILYGNKYSKNKIDKIRNCFLIQKNILRQINNIQEESQLFFFHPMPLFFNVKKVFRSIKAKRITAIGFVCDISVLHLNDKENKSFLKRTCACLQDKILKEYDLIMVPSTKMLEYLISIGIDGNKIIIHGLSDYLIKSVDEKKRRRTDKIVIVGDLTHERNDYIYQLHKLKNLHFNLYGYGFDEKYKETNVSYYGMMNDAELNKKVSEKFGLCWYGSKLEELAGYSAEYMKMNSPHKISFCIANEIPVIVSDEAAFANYVRENHLGILVHNLEELPDILSKIDNMEYLDILSHVKEEGKKLREGYHLERSLLKIDKMCINTDRR